MVNGMIYRGPWIERKRDNGKGGWGRRQGKTDGKIGNTLKEKQKTAR